MNDTIHCALYAILYKIVDDFYDEDIYKEYFPNVNIFFNFLMVIYTIYLFYFQNTKSDIFIFLFFIQICYIIFLSFSYMGCDDLSKIGEINVTLDDPFTIITLIQLPMFIMIFIKTIRENFTVLIKLFFAAFLFGIVQDIDSSLLGKYIFKNKYNNTPNKKKYKLIYRLGLSLAFCLAYKIIDINNTEKCGTLFTIFYLLASVISLYIQIMLEEHKDHKIFIENVIKIRKLLQNCKTYTTSKY